jgi:putative transposase
MREGGLVATIRRRFPRTTDSDHDRPVAPNLLEQQLTAEQPDTVWLADISYIPTDEGWLHLAAIKDLAAREIVGWSMSDSLEAGSAWEALRMAIQRRQPSPGLIHHSDRGVQHACGEHQKLLARHGLRCSMSRRGNGYDSSPMESFFGSLKNELVHRTTFEPRRVLRRRFRLDATPPRRLPPAQRDSALLLPRAARCRSARAGGGG